ncbi:MAG: response regulator [Gammaproteobacteria bacterium]|nr:response regulator [Gammaproteobacteria bacterium]
MPNKQLIFIVDDLEVNRLVLENHIHILGHDTISAENGLLALEMIKEQEPDLVLLDILMPEMDGFQVLEHLKSDDKLCHIPVIMISAMDEIEDITRCIKQGALDFLVKPFDSNLLKARVNAALANKRLHDQQEVYRGELESVVNRLTEIGTALSAEKDYQTLLDVILTHARGITKAEAGTLYLLEGNALHFKVMQNEKLNIFLGSKYEKTIPYPPIQLDKSNVAGFVALGKITINIPDVYKSDLFDFTGPKKFDISVGYRSKSMLVVPVKDHDGDILGVLQLLNAKGPGENEIISFSDEAQNFAESIASQAAMAVENVRLINEMDNLFEAFVHIMATAIDEKSPVTGGHIRRMAELTIFMAQTINDQKEGRFKDDYFDEKQMRQLRIASWMHDIGKVTTPVEIIEKGTKLEAIWDRVHVVDLRLLSVEKEMQINRYKLKLEKMAQNASKEEIQKVDEDIDCKIEELNEIREFIRSSNQPGEFMDDEKIKRLNAIQKMTFKDEEGKSQNYLTENELQNLSIRKGSITEEERKKMQDHAIITLRMLEKIPFTKCLKEVPLFAGTHHEFINGKGYPLGLKGDEIPFEGKLMAVTDIVEALTAADRPYKKAMTMEQVNKILGFMVKDGELDSDLVELLISENIYERYKAQSGN